MSKPRVLLTGRHGQLGKALALVLEDRYEVFSVGHQDMNLADYRSIRAGLEVVRPDLIINAAAYTAVDLAEKETDLARLVNADAPAHFARWGARNHVPLVHYSTDYVFDGGAGAPWDEDAPPAPLNVYGETKLEGERAVLGSGDNALVLRTSWVFSATGRNFVKTILRLAADNETLRIVNDQRGRPTSARWLAEATLAMLDGAKPAKSGLWHLTCDGETTWHGFAEAIVAEARARNLPCKAHTIEGIPTSDYPTPARRPLDSRLSLDKLKADWGLTPPRWQDELGLVMDQIAGA